MPPRLRGGVRSRLAYPTTRTCGKGDALHLLFSLAGRDADRLRDARRLGWSLPEFRMSRWHRAASWGFGWICGNTGCPWGWAIGWLQTRANAVCPYSHGRRSRPWEYGKPLAQGIGGLADLRYCYRWVGGSRRYEPSVGLEGGWAEEEEICARSRVLAGLRILGLLLLRGRYRALVAPPCDSLRVRIAGDSRP